MRIYLSDKSYIDLIELPKYLRCTQQDFLEFSKNTSEDVVLCYDKILKKHYPKKIFRSYKSFGVTPLYDNTASKAYMFSGDLIHKTFPKMPQNSMKYLEFLNSLNYQYNQLVINHYPTKDNYIEMHGDCTRDWVENGTVAIISLYPEHTKNFRTMIIKARESTSNLKIQEIKIVLSPDILLIMNKESQNEFRHGINPDNSTNPRVSLTFREIKNSN